MNTNPSKPGFIEDPTNEDLRTLDELARIGQQMADKLLAQFNAGDPAVVETLLAYEQVRRSVRRTNALRNKIKANAAQRSRQT